MKILLVDVNCKYSSTGKIVYDLYTLLNREGHEAAIAYGRGPVVQEKNIYKFSPKWEVYLHALLTRITGYTGCFSYIATKRLISFMEKFQPDIVHLHDLHGYFINIMQFVEYLREKRIKTVWTFHCEFMYTGKCGHAFECEEWKKECGKCSHLKEYPKSLWKDKTAKMLQQKKNVLIGWDEFEIVSPSEWLAGRIKQSFLCGKQINVIHNGIDTTIFHPKDYMEVKKRYGIKNEKIVLSVAPDIMSENKGGQEVLNIAKYFKQENVIFILIGVENILERLNENTILLGRIASGEELAKYYTMADVFLICSKRETFPTTCLEAICCGTPVVGYDVGGTAETAKGEIGCFVPYGDIEGVVKAIKTFLEEDDKMIEKKCELYGKKRFSKEHMYQEYKNLYETIQKT